LSFLDSFVSPSISFFSLHLLCFLDVDHDYGAYRMV
jgi:hypothetical protein